MKLLTKEINPKTRVFLYRRYWALGSIGTPPNTGKDWKYDNNGNKVEII